MVKKHHFAEPIFWIFCCCSEEHKIFLESITHHSHDKGRLCHALIGAEFMMGHTLVCSRSKEGRKSQGSHQWQTALSYCCWPLSHSSLVVVTVSTSLTLDQKVAKPETQRDNSCLCVHCWGRPWMCHWLQPAPHWTGKPDLVLNLNCKMQTQNILQDQFLDHSCDAPNRWSCTLFCLAVIFLLQEETYFLYWCYWIWT